MFDRERAIEAVRLVLAYDYVFKQQLPPTYEDSEMAVRVVDAILALPPVIDDAMVERAFRAGENWSAEHPDGASEDDEWRDFHRAALEAAFTPRQEGGG